MNARFVDFPFHVDSRGRIAVTDDDDHIRDMIEQVLLTNPGERVNLPDFGCGLKQMVFAPNSDMIATATQFTVSHSLQKWLGDLIDVRQVDVHAEESTLTIEITYLKRTTLEQKQVTISS